MKVNKINLRKFKESLILAQDERWRDALYMQVVREFLTQVADGWVTRKNLPLGGGQQLETAANTPYAFEWNGFPPKEKLAAD